MIVWVKTATTEVNYPFKSKQTDTEHNLRLITFIQCTAQRQVVGASDVQQVHLSSAF